MHMNMFPNLKSFVVFILLILQISWYFVNFLSWKTMRSFKFRFHFRENLGFYVVEIFMTINIIDKLLFIQYMYRYEEAWKCKFIFP